MVQLGELMMILELHRQGLSVTAIARRTGRDPKTAANWVTGGMRGWQSAAGFNFAGGASKGLQSATGANLAAGSGVSLKILTAAREVNQEFCGRIMQKISGALQTLDGNVNVSQIQVLGNHFDISGGTIRLSVGLETLDDLLWDLERGLSAASGARVDGIAEVVA